MIAGESAKIVEASGGSMMQKKRKNTAYALARLKKRFGGAHREGNTWVLPLKATRVIEGQKTIIK